MSGHPKSKPPTKAVNCKSTNVHLYSISYQSVDAKPFYSLSVLFDRLSYVAHLDKIYVYLLLICRLVLNGFAMWGLDDIDKWRGPKKAKISVA